jgi:hypothetical protein
MATLTYWYAQNLSDSDCYSVTAKTKKAAIQKIKDMHWCSFEPVQKRTIQYTDAFDLFAQVSGEGGGASCGTLSGV